MHRADPTLCLPVLSRALGNLPSNVLSITSSSSMRTLFFGHCMYMSRCHAQEDVKQRTKVFFGNTLTLSMPGSTLSTLNATSGLLSHHSPVVCAPRCTLATQVRGDFTARRGRLTLTVTLTVTRKRPRLPQKLGSFLVNCRNVQPKQGLKFKVESLSRQWACCPPVVVCSSDGHWLQSVISKNDRSCCTVKIPIPSQQIFSRLGLGPSEN